MAKISLDGGPSHAGLEGLVKDAQGRVSEIDSDHQGRVPLVGKSTEKHDERAGLGVREKGDEWLGKNSQPSTEKPNSTDKTNETDDPKPAPTAASRSSRTGKAS